MKHINAQMSNPCSGCGVCAGVCPTGAIRLALDEAGFFTARVDSRKCVNCGLCQKACPRFSQEQAGADLRKLPHYALQSRDPSVVKRCSSGGIAHELSRAALEKGWQVCGVTYDLQTDTAKHILIDNTAQLPLIDGSKYLQSDSQEAFSQILHALKTDPQVKFLVFGTPCQIAGMAKAAQLLGARERVLLAELFCHGVPSYLLWQEQCRRIRKRTGQGTFDSLQFRFKKDDWHSYCMKAEKNGKVWYGSREGTLFYQVFFENVLLGDSCYDCPYRKEHSQADLRLGDYWGKKFQSRTDGVSAVFPCTHAGRDALEVLDSSLVKQEADSVEAMLSAQNMSGYHQKSLHDQAMTVLRTGDVLKAVKTYRSCQSGKQKLKRFLLSAAALLPDSLRARLRRHR